MTVAFYLTVISIRESAVQQELKDAVKMREEEERRLIQQQERRDQMKAPQIQISPMYPEDGFKNKGELSMGALSLSNEVPLKPSSPAQMFTQGSQKPLAEPAVPIAGKKKKTFDF